VLVVQALAVHHRNFGLLHRIKVMAVAQLSVETGEVQ